LLAKRNTLMATRVTAGLIDGLRLRRASLRMPKEGLNHRLDLRCPNAF
jgi:hypothetical protein